jgi:hypothetical protein
MCKGAIWNILIVYYFACNICMACYAEVTRRQVPKERRRKVTHQSIAIVPPSGALICYRQVCAQFIQSSRVRTKGTREVAIPFGDHFLLQSLLLYWTLFLNPQTSRSSNYSWQHSRQYLSVFRSGFQRAFAKRWRKSCATSTKNMILEKTTVKVESWNKMVYHLRLQ